MSSNSLSERQAKALNLFLNDRALQRQRETKSAPTSTQVTATPPSAVAAAAAVTLPVTLPAVPKFKFSGAPAPAPSSYALLQASRSENEKFRPAETGISPKHDINCETAADESGSEDEGVKRWLVSEPRKPRKTSERKRADAAAFDIWLETNQKDLVVDGLPVPDDERSLAWLVKSDGSSNIIDSPFDYQVELFERAKLQNTIAVLGTGVYSYTKSSQLLDADRST